MGWMAPASSIWMPSSGEACKHGAATWAWMLLAGTDE
jgi:hypothetical protein